MRRLSAVAAMVAMRTEVKWEVMLVEALEAEQVTPVAMCVSLAGEARGGQAGVRPEVERPKWLTGILGGMPDAVPVSESRHGRTFHLYMTGERRGRRKGVVR